MNDDFAIRVEHVNKDFRLPHERAGSLKNMAVNFARRKKGYEVQHVLKDVSLDIKKGEFFGVVGRNGSGKSTLLKLLAGIYMPTKGSITVNGKLTPFIELGVGFNPELTGRENVFLNGALLGFNRKEMAAMYHDIVEFAELERFMDQKLKNYSSGMQVRLAFSIAIRAQSDILVLDEVLAVGDAAFQTKCMEVFVKLKEESRTIILVTHDMSNVEKLCSRAAVINNGNLIGVYSPDKAASIYSQLNIEDSQTRDADSDSGLSSGEVTLGGLTVNNGVTRVEQNDGLTVELKLRSKNERKRPVSVGLAFYDQFGVNMSGPNSQGIILSSPGDVEYKIAKLPFNPGSYTLTVGIFSEDLTETYEYIEKAARFTVYSDKEGLQGKINLMGKWSQKDD